MIEFRDFSYRYTNGPLIIHRLNLHIPQGAFVLVTGYSGSGKSTLLRAMNGLIPQFHGGQVSGEVYAHGQSTLRNPVRILARWVGCVFQDPETQFVVPRVEDDIRFSMETQGIPTDEMQQRLEAVLYDLEITHLRERNIATLSGGEQQRVAIASTLIARPMCLVLDEPTSQLDPEAAHALLNILVRLNRDYNLTIVLAEHRLERILPNASHLLHVSRDGQAPAQIQFGPIRDLLPHIPLHPPVVEVGLRLGWTPLPLTVEEAYSMANQAVYQWKLPSTRARAPHHPSNADLAFEVQQVSVSYGPKCVLQDFSWRARRGEIIGLLGKNGSGKSTLLKTIVGLLKPSSGAIWLNPVSNIHLTPTANTHARQIGYVPQDPNRALFADTVHDEVAFTLRNHNLPDTTDQFLARVGLQEVADRYPRDLSGGERQRVALVAMLAAEPFIMLLDEPTRGLDYQQKEKLTTFLKYWAAQGKTIVIATHDVEWLATIATHAAVLDQGRLIADGPLSSVLFNVPGFNTQLGSLFGRPDLLTVQQVIQVAGVE